MATTPASIETNGTPSPRFVWPQWLRGRWGAAGLAAAYLVVDVAVVYGLALFLFRNLGASLRSGRGFLLAGMLLFVVAVAPVHRIR